MTSYEPESRNAVNRVKRLTDRAKYDQEAIFDILDRSKGICHVTFKFAEEDDHDPNLLPDDYPVIQAMVFGRVDDVIYLHGHYTTRVMKALATNDVSCCVSVTHVNGYKIAMNPFHSSIFYSSAICFGRPYVCEGEEKVKAMTAITNEIWRHSDYDRWTDSIEPNEAAVKSVTVVGMPIETASAKLSPPMIGDEKHEIEKFASQYWSGLIKQDTRLVSAEDSAYNKAPMPEQVKQLVQTQKQ